MQIFYLPGSPEIHLLVEGDERRAVEEELGVEDGPRPVFSAGLRSLGLSGKGHDVTQSWSGEGYELRLVPKVSQPAASKTHVK